MSAAVIFRMGADGAGLRKDLDAAGASIKRSAAKWGKDLKSSIGGSISGGLAGVISVGALTGVGSMVLDFAGNLADASDAMGIGVEALQELQGAFAQSGASSETVNKGLAKLSETLNAAKNGSAPMVASFRALGVSWEDIHTLAPDEILMKIAASAKDAKDPAERLSLIIDVMGKSGMKMAAGLNGGVEALQKMRDEVSKLTKDEIADLDAAGDAMTTLGNKAKVAAAQAIIGAKALLDSGSPSQWARAGLKMLAGPVLKDFIPDEENKTGPATDAELMVGHSKSDDRRKQREEEAAKPKPELPMSPEDKEMFARIQKQQKAEQKLQAETAEQERKHKAWNKRYEEQIDREIHDEAIAALDALTAARAQAAEDAQRKEFARIDAELEKRKQAIDDEKAARQDALQQFIADAGDPHAASKRKREKRKVASLTAKKDRLDELKHRGGKALADMKKGAPTAKEMNAQKEADFKTALDQAQVLKDIAANTKGARNAQ